MINELKIVEKLIKDRLTEKATELTKEVWREDDDKINKLFKWSSPLPVSMEIEQLTITLHIIRNEIRTIQTHKNG